MTPMSIKAIAKQHWKESYPEAYRLMKLHGVLEGEAQAAAELTLQEMELQEMVGMTTLEAWQASRELWVFRDPMLDWQPPETDRDAAVDALWGSLVDEALDEAFAAPPAAAAPKPARKPRAP